MSKIVKQAQKIVVDHHFEQQIPILSVVRLNQQSEEIIDVEFIESDDKMTNIVAQGLIDELEPSNQKEEHWSSYKVGVESKQLLLKSPTVDNSDTLSVKSKRSQKKINLKTSVLISSVSQKLSRLVEENQIAEVDDIQNIGTARKSVDDTKALSFIDMGQAVEEDPLENGMRVAYERESQLRTIQERIEKQRVEELKEQQKQMKMLSNNISGNNKQYTYDFEGRLMVQNQTKYEVLPPTNFSMQYEVSMLEKKEILQSREQKPSEKGPSIDIQKKKIVIPRSEITPMTDPFKVHDQSQQIDSIILQKGVTFYQGNAKRQGPFYGSSNLHKLEALELTQNLQNPVLGLKLTKTEYNGIIDKSYSLSLGNKTQISKKKQSIEFDSSSIASIRLNHMNQDSIQESINVSSLAGMRHGINQPTKQNNSSINSSMVLVGRRGSIKMNNDSQLSIDELLVPERNEPQQNQPTKHMKLPSIMQYPEITPTAQFSIDLIGRQDWGDVKESKEKPKNPRLPLNLTSSHSLPILVQNPRDRVKSMAQVNIALATRLPPPNVGKVLGHQYKGFKINQ